MRRLLLIVIVTGFAAIVTGAALIALLAWTGQPRAVTTSVATWALSSAIGSDVEVGGSSGSFLRGLELREISIGRDTDQRFEVRRARLEIEPQALLRGDITIQMLELSGLAIDGTRHDDESWTWAGGVIAPQDDDTGPGSSTPTHRIELQQLHLDDVRLRLIWPTAQGPAQLEARLDANLRDFVWPLPDPDRWLPELEAQLSELRVEGGPFPIDQGRLVARHADGEISLSTEQIQGPWGVVDTIEVLTRIEGPLDSPHIPGGHAEASFSRLDPDHYVAGEWPASDLAGFAAFDWVDGEARGRIELSRSHLLGVPVEGGKAQGRVWIEDGRALFEADSIELAADFGRLEASVKGDATGATLAVVERARIRVAALPEAWRPAGLFAGDLSLRARLAGPWTALGGEVAIDFERLAQPEIGVVSGQIELARTVPDRIRVEVLNIDALEGPVPDFSSRAPFSVTVSGSTIGLQGARFEVAGGEISLDGAFSSERFDELQIAADEVEIAGLLQGLSLPETGGRLSAAIVCDGPFDQPSLTGHANWIDPRWGDSRAEHARLELAPDPTNGAQEARLAVVLAEGNALEASASFSTKGLAQRPEAIFEDETLSFEAFANDLDLEFLTRAHVSDEQLPRGRLNARWTGRGPLVEPTLLGRMDWTQAVWRELSADRLSLSIAADDPSGETSLDLEVVQDGHESVRVGLVAHDLRILLQPARLVATPDTRAEIELDGFDLASLDPLMTGTGVFLNGVAHGRVRMTGASVPEALGTIRIEGLGASGPALPVVVGPTAARIDFAGQVARVSELMLPSKDGQAHMKVQASWADPENPELLLRAHTKDFAIDLPGIITGQLDGDAVLAGTPTSLTGEGGLLLHHARIDLPDAEDPIFREITVRYASTGESLDAVREDRSRSLYDALEGQLSLELGDSVWLRGVGAELEMEGTLVARKQADQPAGLYGSLEVASGRIDFQGKWLRVTSGSAIFDGKADPDPYIDATAMHRVDDVSIRARLFGRASNLQLELDSDPPMTTEDQISYLLFDRPTLQIGETDQQNVGAMAAAMAGDYVLGRMGNEIFQEIGIDRVRLSVDDDDSPILEVEKQLNDRVAVRYGRGFGTEGGDRVTIEWRVFRELFLSGEQLTNGESGVDLFWRREY